MTSEIIKNEYLFLIIYESEISLTGLKTSKATFYPLSQVIIFDKKKVALKVYKTLKPIYQLKISTYESFS